jgi:hypothetical protein
MYSRQIPMTISASNSPSVAVGRGAAVFAAERETLQEAQRHQQNGCRPADADFTEQREVVRRVGGQEADHEGRRTHDHDGDEEGVLAADQIADAAEQKGAEGTH